MSATRIGCGRSFGRRWIAVPTWVVGLMLWTPLLLAQDEDYVPEEQEQQDEGGIDLSVIDEILAQDEAVLSSPGLYNYDPGARRDPFRSLIQSTEEDDELGERPDGIAGLLIDDIELEGVFVTASGPVAQIASAQQEASFLLRPGDQLWDGDVVDISMGEIVFKQSVNDPTALRPFRDVVKKLNP